MNKINGRTPEEIKLGLEYCPLCNKSCPYHNEKVTHWMPLPEPPKEEK